MGRYSEAGHPLSPDIQRQLYLDQSNISHRINEFWWEGNFLKGIVEAANTARGKDFDGLIRQSSKVAFSLRAVGPITKKKGDAIIIENPLTVFSYDWVIHPSHPTAYMDEIISEAGKVGNVICEAAGVFTPFYSDKVIDYIKEQSKNFKVISETFELNTSKTYLSEDCKKVFIQNDNDTIAVLTENFLSNEISSYMTRFK